MTRKILIIDSNVILTKKLTSEFKKENWDVETILEGNLVYEKEDIDADIDMILLDLNIDGINGQELCRKIRSNSNVPIIIITKRTGILDKIVAFESGADDYLIKPFEFLELKARIKALFRRIELSNKLIDNKEDKKNYIEEINLEGFKINILNKKISFQDEKIKLTGKEFDIFYTLITNPKRVFSREDLLGSLWEKNKQGETRTTRIIDVHIRRIREKLGEVTEYPYIKTKWGIGYYFDKIKL